MVTATDLLVQPAGNDASGSNYGIPSFARVATRPYLIAVLSTANATADVPVLGGEGTWDLLGGGQFSSGGGTFFRIDVFGHVPTVSDAVTNVTITYATTQTGVSYSAIELGGMPDDSANNGANLWPTLNVVYDDTANTLQTADTVTLPSGGGATVLFAAMATNAGFTLEGTYTEVCESARTGPARTLTTGFLNASDTSVVATTTGGGTAKIGLVGIALITDLTVNVHPPLLSTPTTMPTPTFEVAGMTIDASILLTPTFAGVPIIEIAGTVPLPPPTITGSVSSAELLEPSITLGIRADRFEWELLDRDLNVIDRLYPILDQAPTITSSIDSTIMRTINGLLLTLTDAAKIDPLVNRLRPVMVLQNNARFPMGVFLFGDHQRSVSERTTDVWQSQMFDQGLILQDKTASSLSLNVGQSITGAIVFLLGIIGMTNVQVVASAATLSEPVAWPAGTERYQIIADLAKTAGCLKPFFDNSGVLRVIQAPDPANVVDAFHYGKGRIIADSIVEADDSYRAPNRYIAIGQGSETPVVGYYDIPAEAPHSAANRGYVVSETYDLPGLESGAAATLAAQAQYLSDTRAWGKVTFSSPLDPRHDIYAVVQYDGVVNGLFLEVGFTQELVSGGEHVHELTRLWGPTAPVHSRITPA